MSSGPVDHSDASLQVGQVQNGALLVHCPGQVWNSVRPAESGDRPLPPALLPDWASLQWEQILPSDLSSGEWVIHGNGYRVNVYGDPRGAKLSSRGDDGGGGVLRGGRALPPQPERGANDTPNLNPQDT